MRHFEFLLPAFFSLLLFSACEEEENGPKLTQKEKMLTSRTWKASGLRVDIPIDWHGNNNPITNIYANEPCLQDNTIKYLTDKTFISDEGSSRCDDVQNTTGTWVLNSTETVITETSEGESTSLDIISLTDQNLKLRYSIDLFRDGTIYTFEADFTAI